MKKIIKGRSYDTDKAEELASIDNGIAGIDHESETLYRKRTGEYFIHGVGGSHTKYAQPLGDGRWSSGELIHPLAYDQAQQWAEDHLDGDAYEAIFGAVEDGQVAMTISISTATKAKLERYAARHGIPQVKVIEDLIDSLD